jgi:hypothetical protein
MTLSARSLRVFAIYLGLLALALLVVPNVLLSAFGLPATSEVWIRVVGMLVALLGVYYWVGAASGFVPFFQATILARLSVPVFFLIFVLSAWVEWPLLLFAVLDVLGAVWTWWDLRHVHTAA